MFLRLFCNMSNIMDYSTCCTKPKGGSHEQSCKSSQGNLPRAQGNSHRGGKPGGNEAYRYGEVSSVLQSYRCLKG